MRYVLGGLLIVAGIAWILLAGFAGAMHPVPQNPSFGEMLPGFALMAVGGLTIWSPFRIRW